MYFLTNCRIAEGVKNEIIFLFAHMPVLRCFAPTVLLVDTRIRELEQLGDLLMRALVDNGSEPLSCAEF